MVFVEWFSSYLESYAIDPDRTAHIKQSQRKLSCGVTQGSVLGPLLFLLYVIDIHQCSNKLKFYLLADDTSILYADKNLKSLENIVNIELRNLHDWLTSSKLTLNTTKTNFVIFYPFQKRITYQPNLYMFDNEKNRNVTLESKNYIK